MLKKDNSITTIIDGGARYGIHPSWVNFGGDKLYYAFEPDQKECESLAERFAEDCYFVVNKALWYEECSKKFNFYRHKGQSSFFEPDLDNDWFKQVRPDDGIVDKVQLVECISIDGFCSAHGISADFLKLDVEGAEYEVLLGAISQLQHNVIGLRLEVEFYPVKHGQKLFHDLQALLLENGFELLNLDYFGRGMPKSEFYGDPDPCAAPSMRYGFITGTDAVWVKKLEYLFDKNSDDKDAIAYSVIKYAYFCMLNNAPDVAVWALQTHVKQSNQKFSEAVQNSTIFKSLRKMLAVYLGRWRVVPNEKWLNAIALYEFIFGLIMPGSSEYYDFLKKLED